MNITYYEKERIFKLDTPNTSYVMGLVDEENFLGHVYYGKYIETHSLGYLLRTDEAPFVPSENNGERCAFYDSFPFEYPTGGIGDFRESCLDIKTIEGYRSCSFSFETYNILKGKPELKDLPSTFGVEDNCMTLEITGIDKTASISIKLLYTVFSDTDAIARSVEIENQGEGSVYLNKVYSACLDMDNQNFDYISLHGGWSRERHIQKKELGYGRVSADSYRGESSHQEHPFMALATRDTTQETGEVYAMNFVYSGDFCAQAERSQFDRVRMTMGIHPNHFCWKLEVGKTFQAPEVIMVYSNTGLDGMTHSYHNLYRKHLIRGIYKDSKRPVLINNWEATYFNFTTEKLLEIARQSAALGIEMFVMDDGWFGNRNSDRCSLGDWVVNEEKLPGGLNYLVSEVNKIGMKFGIWFEPEMVSPDSDLYRTHPDWAIAVPGRTPAQQRKQYVLDLSRKEVVDYVYESVAKIIRSANIEYVKWDMNRQLTDLYSYGLQADCQEEISHRYVLGVYELQDRLTKEFPNLLLENCSSGGGRFDPGMLYYSPQIWCSDNTDAIERLATQEGTALIYPLSTMGSHVSDCPNHMTGRTTPFETRGAVALAGTFGYELDVTKITEQEREQIPAQIKQYHKYQNLIQQGNYYRIASFADNHRFDCWEVVSQDQTEVLVTFIQVLAGTNEKSKRIKLKGLDPKKSYRIKGEETVFMGEALMCAGMYIQNQKGDFAEKIIHLTCK